LKAKLLSYVQTGGRISITTDTWSARNRHEFTAVTGHWIDESWQHHSTVLDLMELVELIVGTHALINGHEYHCIAIRMRCWLMDD
jgi:hypothetical protein